MKLARVHWVLAAALAAGIGGGGYWLRERAVSPQALLRRLPRKDAVVASLDFAALRRAGILQLLSANASAQDPDYRAFIDKSGFDYTRDLDGALLSLSPAGKFLLLRGRFDWDKLSAYAVSQGGKCANRFCRMSGSGAERQISFFPLRGNLMALAVSPDDSAALRLNSEGPQAEAAPDAPVWVAIPPAALQSGEGLPTGARMFARAAGGAESVTLALGPEGQRLAARLSVRCASDAAAAEVSAQLTRATALLRELIAQARQTPNPEDLSGVLANGAFRSQGPEAFGYWPIERGFLQRLSNGK